MEHFLTLVLLVSVLVHVPAQGQAYTGGCGAALEDIPDPASDSCVAFYRCYRNRQYSLRCPLGQAFHFDRSRCRPETEVDCPLQLQRFQAPAVPHYLRPPQAQQDREVEIRVVHVAASPASNNNQVYNGGQLSVTGQTASQGGQPVSSGQPVQTAPQPDFQQAPFLFRTAAGQVFQVQGVQGQQVQGAGQPQYIQPPVQQSGQGPIVQGQNLQNPQQNSQSQAAQGQNNPNLPQQNFQGQVNQGQNQQTPPQQNIQSQTAQGQNMPPTLQQDFQGKPNQGHGLLPQQNIQGQTSQGKNSTPAQQIFQGQTNSSHDLPYPAQLIAPDQTVQGQKLPSPSQQNAQGQLEGQTNISIFAPSSSLPDQPPRHNS